MRKRKFRKSSTRKFRQGCGLIKIGKKLKIAVLLLMFVAGAHAQDVSLVGAVDRTELASGDQLQLTFSLSGTTSPKNFRPPALDDFLVLSGPNQSTNVQFVNGSVSQSISFTYILQPKKEGKFTIGAASIEMNGKTLQSEPIKITVTKGAPPAAGTQSKKGSADESQELGKQIGDNLFLKVIVDKTHLVQGEQITATYKLYNRVSLANLSYSRTPSLTGFWSEDIEEIKQVQFTREALNGKQYNVAVLKKVALFPQRPGTLEIDPMQVTCVVQVRNKKRSNNPLDQFFND